MVSASAKIIAGSFILLRHYGLCFQLPTGQMCRQMVPIQRDGKAATEEHLWFASQFRSDRMQLSATESNVVVSENDTRSGILVLLTVPVAWGTFEVATRYVYSVDPPIPAFLFSLAYYAVAVTSLLFVAFLSNSLSKNDEKEKDSDTISSTEKWPIVGGMELGSYLFAGNLLQVLGLKTVQSDRAAFLLQLTTVFVPLLEAFIARDLFAVPRRVWLACGVALTGVGMMGLDDGPVPTLDFAENAVLDVLKLLTDSLTHWTIGDALIVAAALVYTFHCVRLEGYAKSTTAVKLAASKASTETVLSALAVAGVVLCARQAETMGVTVDGEQPGSLVSFLVESGQETVAFLSETSDAISSTSFDAAYGPAILATVWTGLVPVAYTIYAQSYGQSLVRPVTANLIYTIQPVCTALFAWLLLNESLGPAGYLGGALIGSAVLLVVAGESPNETVK